MPDNGRWADVLRRGAEAAKKVEETWRECDEPWRKNVFDDAGKATVKMATAQAAIAGAFAATVVAWESRDRGAMRAALEAGERAVCALREAVGAMEAAGR